MTCCVWQTCTCCPGSSASVAGPWHRSLMRTTSSASGGLPSCSSWPDWRTSARSTWPRSSRRYWNTPHGSDHVCPCIWALETTDWMAVLWSVVNGLMCFWKMSKAHGELGQRRRSVAIPDVNHTKPDFDPWLAHPCWMWGKKVAQKALQVPGAGDFQWTFSHCA